MAKAHFHTFIISLIIKFDKFKLFYIFWIFKLSYPNPKDKNVYVVLFNVQFLQIQTVLQSTGEDGQDELVKLRDDLVELIHVSEGFTNNSNLCTIINCGMLRRHTYIVILHVPSSIDYCY